MAKTKAPNRIRIDVKTLKNKIKETATAITSSKQDAKEANADIEALRETLQAGGIPRKALAWAMQYCSWDEDSRAGFDVAFVLCREALGQPFENQLFDAEGNPNLHVPKAEEDGDSADASAGDGQQSMTLQ